MNPVIPAGAQRPVSDPTRAIRASAGREAVKILAAFAGIGAGTISFGISTTLLGAARTPWSITGAGISILWGLGLIIWAAQDLRRRHQSPFRAVLRLVPVAAFFHLAAVAAGIWAPGQSLRTLDGAALSCAALELIILASLGWLGRHRGTDRHGTEPVQSAAGTLLAAIMIPALLVSAITTSGLSATAAGHSEVPHGEHTSPLINPSPAHHH